MSSISQNAVRPSPPHLEQERIVYPDNAEGIRLWSKQPLSWADYFSSRLIPPSGCIDFDAHTDEWLEEHQEEVLRTRAVWNAQKVFTSKDFDTLKKEYWESCPMRENEFARALSFYYAGVEKRQGAFGVGFFDICPSSAMTSNQQLTYIRFLAKMNPRVLAENFRAWTSTEEQIVTALEGLSTPSTEHELLLVGAPKDVGFLNSEVWGDGRVHPELDSFLDAKEKEIISRLIDSDPRKIQYLRRHIERLDINFSQFDRDVYFYKAAASNPLFFTSYREILKPSEETRRTVCKHIFFQGFVGDVDLFRKIQSEISLEDQKIYIEFLIYSSPLKTLTELYIHLSQMQFVKAFRNAVKANPENCVYLNDWFLTYLNPLQRKEILDIIYNQQPEVLQKISYEGLPEVEKKEYLDMNDWIAWRRFWLTIMNGKPIIKSYIDEVFASVYEKLYKQPDVPYEPRFYPYV